MVASESRIGCILEVEILAPYTGHVYEPVWKQARVCDGAGRERRGQGPGCLYNTATGSLHYLQRLKLEKKLCVHDGCVNTICWNDNGTLILSGSDDQHLAITDPFSGKNVVKFKSGHRSNIFSAKFLPGSMDREVVSCSGSGEIFYTDVDRKDSYGTNRFDCHFGTTYKLLVVPNEAATFLSCGDDGTVRFFDLRTKTSCSKFNCEEDVVIHLRHAVTAMAVDPVIPFQLAVASSDGIVRLYDRRMLKTRETGGSGDSLICRFLPPMLGGEKRHYRITSLNYRLGSHDVLVNYSSENIYLFNTYETNKKQNFSTKPQAESSGATSKSVTMTGPSRTSNGGTTGACASADNGSDSECAFKPIKRLRLRGDWSDTGPDARPESEEPALSNTIMQRMSDLLTRMLNSRNDRSGGQEEEEGAAGGNEGEDELTRDETVTAISSDAPFPSLAGQGRSSIFSEGLVSPDLSSQDMESGIPEEPDPASPDTSSVNPDVSLNSCTERWERNETSVSVCSKLPLVISPNRTVHSGELHQGTSSQCPARTTVPLSEISHVCPVQAKLCLSTDNFIEQATIASDIACAGGIDMETGCGHDTVADRRTLSTVDKVHIGNTLLKNSDISQSVLEDRPVSFSISATAAGLELDSHLSQIPEIQSGPYKIASNTKDAAYSGSDNHESISERISANTSVKSSTLQPEGVTDELLVSVSNGLSPNSSSQTLLALPRQHLKEAAATQLTSLQDSTSSSVSSSQFASLYTVTPSGSANTVAIADNENSISQLTVNDVANLTTHSAQSLTNITLGLTHTASSISSGFIMLTEASQALLKQDVDQLSQQGQEPSVDSGPSTTDPKREECMHDDKSAAAAPQSQTSTAEQAQQAKVDKGKGVGKSSLRAAQAAATFAPYNSGKMRISVESAARSTPGMLFCDTSPTTSSLSDPNVTELDMDMTTSAAIEENSLCPSDQSRSRLLTTKSYSESRGSGQLTHLSSSNQDCDRQRRVGYSLPPTGNFQLDEESEEEAEDMGVGLAYCKSSAEKERMSQAVQKIQEVYRKKREARELAKMMEVPQSRVLMKYSGHRNCRTMIKEANFYGDHYVMSGSDCGRILAWERETGRLVMYMDADRHVVNCVQPNLYVPVLASSGIDYDIKIWSPLQEEPQFDDSKAEMIIHRNELMLEETRDTVTVPAAFMLRILASLSQIRTGRNTGRPQGQSNSESQD